MTKKDINERIVGHALSTVRQRYHWEGNVFPIVTNVQKGLRVVGVQHLTPSKAPKNWNKKLEVFVQ
jgi:hypothetical protein